MKSLILFLIICIDSYAGESFIPLEKNKRLPSDDLVYNEKVLAARDADVLSKKEGIDLATLWPKENAIWKNTLGETLSDQEAISINNHDVLIYQGSIASNLGLFRFNVIPDNGNKFYTVHLDKNLHTILLRKNILRMLGYQIPAMKYLKSVIVQFENQESMKHFIEREIPDNTLGASERWIRSNFVNENNLTVTLNDVAITEPSEFDNYNVSLGVPDKILNSRSLRSLVIPYALVDLYESVNKFSWISGKIDNQSVILEHFTDNQFSTTVDDATWMMSRLNSLSRENIKKAIEDSYFPEEVSAVLVEKIISRRNSMSRLFAIKHNELPFNNKISMNTILKKGKLKEVEFPGYASRFAHGNAESPFDQLQYFIYSKIQSNVIGNAIGLLNDKLGVETNDARVEYYKKQFNEGLDHFVKTGEFLPIGVGTWISPVLRGQLIFSRDIMLGNYLGTNNLVQLVDTFGASATLGVELGIEGIGGDVLPSFNATTSIVRTYSHLKPVKSLKESLKEPYKNIFVTMIKNELKEKFLTLSELKKLNDEIPVGQPDKKGETPKSERQKKVEEMIKEIDKNLSVGESLILTDRLMPQIGGKINFSHSLFTAGVGVNAGTTVLKRIHIYKKSASILQIFDDSGFVKNLNLNFQIRKFIPILTVDANFDDGKYNVKSYTVDLGTDFTKNPNFFSNALGIYQVLEGKNFEILAGNNPPVELDVDFNDRRFGISLLPIKIKSLNGKTYYDVKAKNGVGGKYFSLEKNFLIGLSPETLTRQVMNYYLAKEVKEFKLGINDDESNIPGQSLFGRSRTERFRFEAVIDDDKEFNQKFLTYTDVKQGWAMSKKSLKKFMRETNQKFDTVLFEVDKIDFKKLRLYSIGYSLSLYDRGIERILNIAPSEIQELENKYISEAGCFFNDLNINTRKCGSLLEVRNQIENCNEEKMPDDKAACSVKLFEKLLINVNFPDLRKLIGDKNFYLIGTIDGFRVKSEILNDSIISNSIGSIGSKDWDGPISIVRDLIGISSGEFRGNWIREIF